MADAVIPAAAFVEGRPRVCQRSLVDYDFDRSRSFVRPSATRGYSDTAWRSRPAAFLMYSSMRVYAVRYLVCMLRTVYVQYEWAMQGCE